MEKYLCPCGYEYDPAAGDPENGGKLMGHLNDGDYISYGQKDFRGECTIQWTGVYSSGELKPISKADIVMTLCSQEG